MLLPSGRKGKYEGLAADGRARVKVNGKIVLVKSDVLALSAEDEDVDFTTSFLEELDILDEKLKSGPKPIKPKSRYEIDLHIEVLDPSHKAQAFVHVLEIQMEACRNFIEESYANKRNPITIIHGRGEGILRNEIKSLLDHDHRIGLTKTINRGGATEVWFR